MGKELDQMRSIFESAPVQQPATSDNGDMAEWNSQFEAAPTEDPDRELNERIGKIKAKYELARKTTDPSKAVDIAMKENFSLLESDGDCPVEDEVTRSEREQRDHEMKVNRVMDSWFQAKTAAMSAKYEELKLKYPDNPERVKNAFDKWLKLTEAAMSGQDKEDPKGDDDDEKDELASEKDLDDPDDKDDDSPEDPPELDPDDDSVLNDSGSDEDDNEEFTEEENEIIDGLIESETDAISDYSKALNETNNPVARKLYTEILGDESKHLAQLKYLKAKKNGEDYVPKDAEAKDELDELLEGVLTETDIL